MTIQRISPASAIQIRRHTPDVIKRRERWLLGFAALFVILNRVGLAVVREESVQSLWVLVVWLACAGALHFALEAWLPERDPLILPIVMLLSGWGLTLVARLAPAFATRQALWLLVATVGTLAILAILPENLRILERYRYTLLTAGLGLLAATFILGVNPSGDPFAPRLWLGLSPIYFQPSELLKVLMIVFVASYLAEKRELIVGDPLRLLWWRLARPLYIAPLLLVWGFALILLVWQRDLGTASLFFIVFLGILYASTGESIYVVSGLVLLIVAGFLGYRLFDVVQLRIDTWWNPWPEADNRAFQIIQSLLALVSGGVVGQGVGQGAPTFVPVVHSDFVFVAIAEEWGLVGALGVIACFALLVMRAFRIALDNIGRSFHALTAAGIGMLLATQTLLIMGGALKLIPLTGVTLPFVSYGGSSLLVSFILIAMLLRISDPVHAPPITLMRRRQSSSEFTP